MPLDPAQAVDLSALGKPQQQPSAPVVHDCKFCGLRHRGAPHETVEDCLQTCLPYVEMFLELQANTQQLLTGAQRMERTNTALLDANERLARENERLKADLRDARKGTPQAAKSVLEGAEDLAASMKKAVQPPTRSANVTSDDARNYLQGMGVPQAEIDATPDEGLSDLYEKYAGGS